MLKLGLLVFAFLALGGCSVMATRPVQEMANAEVALRAAKDLNADSLVPELYRGAVDNYFKAKRDYRLKNFENAKKHAMRATRLAEQAEFEAYRLGGATPEAASKFSSPEGSGADAEEAFRQHQASQPGPEEPTLPPVKPEPAKTESAEEDPGVDYNELQRQKEEENKAREQSEKDKKPPSGNSGPLSTKPSAPKTSGATGSPAPTSAVPAKQPAPPSNVIPQIGAAPPKASGIPSGLESPDTGPRDFSPTEPFFIYDDSPARKPGIPDMDARTIPELGKDESGNENVLRPLGSRPILEKEELDFIGSKPFQDLSSGNAQIPEAFER